MNTRRMMRELLTNKAKEFIFRLVSVAAMGMLVSSLGASATANQVKNDSSRRENSLITAIETAGGKVYKISASSDEREISFYLSSKPIQDEHLKEINGIQNVVWLNLAGTKITDAGLKNLVGMPLKKLHLERTTIGDAGLVELKSLKELEYLNLYGTKVTDAGLEHLKELKNLKRLYVWQTGVTEAGMKTLMDAMPGLQVVGEVKLTPVVVEEEPKEDDAKMKQAEPDAKAEPTKEKDAEAEKAKAEPAKKEAVKKEPAKEKAEAKPSTEKPDDKKPADKKPADDKTVPDKKV